MGRLITKRKALIFIAVVLFLVAWNRNMNLLYGMFAILASLIILSHILPRYAIKGLTVTRTLQPVAFEDEEIEVKVCVEKNAWTKGYMIEITDSMPAAGPAYRKPMVFVAKLPVKRKREYSFKTVCYKRGVYTVGPVTVSSAYPLGIASVNKPADSGTKTLTVYPKLFSIAALPLMAGTAMPMSGTEAMAKSGGNEDFFGTREYRQGDSLKFIHWPSTARHGQLIVKEFEIRASTEVTVLIDLHKDSCTGSGRETTLEYAVKIAGSVARYAIDKGHHVQLIGHRGKQRVVPSARGTDQLALILDMLAEVQADGSVPYHRVIELSAGLLRDGGTAVLVFSRHDFDIRDYVYPMGLLRSKRIKPVCVFLSDKSFQDAAAMPADEHVGISPGDRFVHEFIKEFAGESPSVYFISKGDNLQDIFAV